MTLAEINSKISQQTGADNSINGYASATRLTDVNTWQHKIAMIMVGAQDDSDFDDPRRSDYPIKYYPLVANTRDYTIPVSEKVLKIKRVDLSYDGTNTYRANRIDAGELPFGLTIPSETTAESTVDTNFSKTDPAYDSKYNSLFIYPQPSSSDVTSGGYILVEWSREMMEYTTAEWSAGTESPGFESAFHRILYLGPSYEYCYANNLPQADRIYRELQGDLELLKKTYGQKQTDRVYSLTPKIGNFK